MTERLYYDDSYLREFDAVVTSSVRNEDGTYTVYLDKSAFYPTSGGQPFDTGTLGDANILDVSADKDGDVAHIVDAPVSEGTRVHCRIDWERRFDHMQQHAGEHILAGCVWRELHGHTIGLHLGHDSSSIDVDFPDGRTHLTDTEQRMLEDEVNLRIQRDVPIKCWFPDAEELSSLPLRKPPTVSEHIRIVKIGDDEFCACGGTHPSTAGQIGLFKLLDARPSRGKVRLTFVCGKRAFEYLRNCFDALRNVNELTSSTMQTVAGNVQTLLDRLKDTEYRLNNEKTEYAMKQLSSIYANAETANGMRIVKYAFDGLDFDGLTKLASALIANSGTVALLASRQEGSSLLVLFARSKDVEVNMSALMKNCGVRGGGKPDFARGSAADESVLGTACAALSGGAE